MGRASDLFYSIDKKKGIEIENFNPFSIYWRVQSSPKNYWL